MILPRLLQRGFGARPGRSRSGQETPHRACTVKSRKPLLLRAYRVDSPAPETPNPASSYQHLASKLGRPAQSSVGWVASVRGGSARGAVACLCPSVAHIDRSEYAYLHSNACVSLCPLAGALQAPGKDDPLARPATQA